MSSREFTRLGVSVGVKIRGGGGATLSDNTYESNTIDLVRQACDSTNTQDVLEGEALSTTELCPEYDYATQDLALSVFLSESEAEY